MATRDGFAELTAHLTSGSDEAAAQVFHRFAGQLIALARTRLDSWMLAKLDPEDIVQSVYRSFFARLRDGKVQLINWDSLWGLLTLMTVRKCANKVNSLRAGRRAVERETPLDQDLFAREPTPLEAALLAEAVEQLLLAFEPPERAVLELSLQGYTASEISTQLDRAERSVRRIRERARRRLLRLHEANADPT